ncbi:hypothetical protein IX51_03685 [uncultured archaeon]|nr:hypothetical protein IX51_03685 [uncultured archaeon]
MPYLQTMYVSELEGSPSLEVVNIVLERLARGDKLISLAIGEPMYDTPKEIIDVANREMLNGNTHYTSSYGIADFRNAVVNKTSKKNSINAEIKNTIFMTSKQAIYAAMLAIAGKKREILMPDPGYFYGDPAKLAGFEPVVYNLSEDNSLDVSKIEEKITPDTSAVFLNTPSNPTGRVLERKSLEELIELAKEHNFKIISDEAYEDLVYEKKHVSIGSLEDAPEHVISIFTLSKSYSMTGWRSGYTVAGEDIIKNMARVIEHTYTCAPPFIQKASAYALENGDGFIKKFRDEFREKRDFVYKRLNEIEGVECGPMEGAFYAFPTYDKNVEAGDLAKGLLNKYDVALLPGTAFGDQGEHRVRISFSGTKETLETGIDRFEDYLLKDVS